MRDIAFVDIHDSEWQLAAVRPRNSSEARVAEWNATIANALENTNVRCQWLAPETPDAGSIRDLFSRRGEELVLAVRGLNGQVAPLWPAAATSPADLEAVLGTLVQSVSREEVLREALSSLCVLLVVDGAATPESRRAEIHRNTLAAAERVSRQAWALDKATQRGPQVVTITADERERERWLLWSVGIDPDAQDSSVVVIYGAGRCLGEPITEGNIEEDRLVQMASVCGRDCECDLDRRWLYGTQMLLRWDERREALAESQLDFDPSAAMVIAETNAILARAASRHTSGAELPVPGLVIHDLAPLDDMAAASADHPRAKPTSVGALASDPERRAEPDTVASLLDGNAESSVAPWLMAGALLAAALVAATYVLRRQDW